MLSGPLFAQVKIGANPTIIDPSHSLEVEASNGMKTSVNKTNGKVTIQDGSQGDGRIFTSDANGKGTWKESTSPVYYGSFNTVRWINRNTVGTVPLNTKLGTGYNSSDWTVSVPAAGMYRITGGMRCRGTVNANQEGIIVLNEAYYYPSDNITVKLNTSFMRTFSVVSEYEPNDKIFLSLNNQSSEPMECIRGFIFIERLNN